MRGGSREERWLRRVEQTLVEQRLQRDHPGPQRLGVRRGRIAIGGQLQRREAEDTRGAVVVAGAAVVARRHAVPLAGRDLDDVGQALGRHQRRIRLRLVPRVGRVGPGIGGDAPQHPRLDLAPVERELLPETRADRELPRVGVPRRDPAADRQLDPARLVGAVGPQRVLRRERPVPRIDRQRAGQVEPGVRQPLRQRRRRQRPDGQRGRQSERQRQRQPASRRGVHRFGSSGGSIGDGTLL